MIKGIHRLRKKQSICAFYIGFLLVFPYEIATMNKGEINKQELMRMQETGQRRIDVLMKHIQPGLIINNHIQENTDMNHIQTILKTILITSLASYGSAYGMLTSQALTSQCYDGKFVKMHREWEEYPTREDGELLSIYCKQQKDLAEKNLEAQLKQLKTDNIDPKNDPTVADLKKTVSMWNQNSQYYKQVSIPDSTLADSWEKIPTAKEEAEKEAAKNFFKKAETIKKRFENIILRLENQRNLDHKKLLDELQGIRPDLHTLTKTYESERRSKLVTIISDMENHHKYSLADMQNYLKTFLSIVDTTREIQNGSLEASAILLKQNTISLGERGLECYLESPFARPKDKEILGRFLQRKPQISVTNTDNQSEDRVENDLKSGDTPSYTPDQSLTNAQLISSHTHQGSNSLEVTWEGKDENDDNTSDNTTKQPDQDLSGLEKSMDLSASTLLPPDSTDNSCELAADQKPKINNNQRFVASPTYRNPNAGLIIAFNDRVSALNDRHVIRGEDSNNDPRRLVNVVTSIATFLSPAKDEKTLELYKESDAYKKLQEYDFTTIAPFLRDTTIATLKNHNATLAAAYEESQKKTSQTTDNTTTIIAIKTPDSFHYSKLKEQVNKLGNLDSPTEMNDLANHFSIFFHRMEEAEQDEFKKTHAYTKLCNYTFEKKCSWWLTPTIERLKDHNESIKQLYEESQKKTSQTTDNTTTTTTSTTSAQKNTSVTSIPFYREDEDVQTAFDLQEAAKANQDQSLSPLVLADKTNKKLKVKKLLHKNRKNRLNYNKKQIRKRGSKATLTVFNRPSEATLDGTSSSINLFDDWLKHKPLANGLTEMVATEFDRTPKSINLSAEELQCKLVADTFSATVASLSNLQTNDKTSSEYSLNSKTAFDYLKKIHALFNSDEKLPQVQKETYEKFKNLDLSSFSLEWDQNTRNIIHTKLASHNITLHKDYRLLKGNLHSDLSINKYKAFKKLAKPKNQNLKEHFEKELSISIAKHQAVFQKQLECDIEIIENKKFSSDDKKPSYDFLEEAERQKVLPEDIQKQFNTFKKQNPDIYKPAEPKINSQSKWSWINPLSWFSSVEEPQEIDQKSTTRRFNLFSWLVWW